MPNSKTLSSNALQLLHVQSFSVNLSMHLIAPNKSMNLCAKEWNYATLHQIGMKLNGEEPPFSGPMEQSLLLEKLRGPKFVIRSVEVQLVGARALVSNNGPWEVLGPRI